MSFTYLLIHRVYDYLKETSFETEFSLGEVFWEGSIDVLVFFVMAPLSHVYSEVTTLQVV